MTILEQINAILVKVGILRKQLALQTSLTPLLVRKSEALISLMKEHGYGVMVNQGFRSKEEQDYLYAQGRTRPGAIITNAKGGESFHNYGVAFDMVFIDDGRPSWSGKFPWALLGQAGKALGLEWGGDWASFQDRPHFQITQGYSLTDFQKGNVDYNLYT